MTRYLFTEPAPAAPRTKPQRAALTPLDSTRTVKRPTFRYRNRPDGPTRTETREATSADGVWTYIREESPGTPWLTRHNPTGEIAAMASTLRQAREATAAGWTQNALERHQAERQATSA